MSPIGLQTIIPLTVMSEQALPSATQRATSILLPHIMDYLLLLDILRVMAVSRLWRDHAINHYTYYGQLYIREDDPPGWLSLFRTRISRSYDRPISVRVRLGQPNLLLHEITNHLPHIRSLVIIQSETHDFTPIIEALCAPADILCTLSLHYEPGPQEPPVSLPPNFLAGHAPLLERVYISDIALSSGIPGSFSNIEILSFGTVFLSSDLPLVLPNPFEQCSKLRVLHLLNDVTLASEARQALKAWERMSEVTFSSETVGVEWPAFQLPLAAVPTVASIFGDAAAALALADTLPGTLEVTLPPPRREQPWSPFNETPYITYKANLRSVSNPGKRVRQLEGQVSDFARGSLAAFCVPSLTDRIVRLVLALSAWDDFVGLRVFGPFPALEELVLTVDFDANFASSATKKLSSPRLKQLVLRGEDHQVADLAAISNFAFSSLPEAKFPLRLQLDGINLTRVSNGSSAAFSSIGRWTVT